MQSRAAFEAVIRCGFIIGPACVSLRVRGFALLLHLLSAEDESLLDGWDAFFFFNALFYPGHLVLLAFGVVRCGCGFGFARTL
jgi:hypothetical protein